MNDIEDARGPVAALGAESLAVRAKCAARMNDTEVLANLPEWVHPLWANARAQELAYIAHPVIGQIMPDRKARAEIEVRLCRALAEHRRALDDLADATQGLINAQGEFPSRLEHEAAEYAVEELVKAKALLAGKEAADA